MRSFHLRLALLALLVVAGCSTGGKKYDDTPINRDWKAEASDVQGKEGKEFREIYTLFGSGAYDTTEVRAGQFIKKYPKSQLVPHVLNLRGLVYLSKRHPLQASKDFAAALRASRDSDFKQFLLYNLAASQFEAGQLKEAQKNLEPIDEDDLDLSTRLKFHYLKAKLHLKAQRTNEAAEELILASNFLPYMVKHKEQYDRTAELLTKQLNQVLDSQLDPAKLQQIVEKNPESPYRDQLLYRLGVLAIKAKSPKQAERFLQDLVSNYPSSTRYNDAVEMLRALQSQSEVNAKAVGILVPMTGKYAKFGQNTVNAIALAFRIYNAQSSSPVTLFIEDSGETAESSVKALEKLYFDHHVVAVLGPLLSKGVDEVAKRADELGVPVITLAQKQTPPADFVIFGAITPEAQAADIARYAIQKRGMKRFAILHPRDKFGFRYRDHFWNAVEALGGEVVGVEAYTPEETDFREVISKLVGTYYQDARKKELDELAKIRNEQKITKRTRLTEKYFKLPPVTDFDAIFIPDQAKTVSQILPTFAYSDVDKTQYLGIGTWNSPSLLERSGEYAEGALFVDVFYPKSQSAEMRYFVSQYEKTFGLQPTAMEALAFDAALILERSILTGKSSGGRSEIQQRLGMIQNFPGVTGLISYKDHAFARELKVLTVQNKQIIEAF